MRYRRHNISIKYSGSWFLSLSLAAVNATGIFDIDIASDLNCRNKISIRSSNGARRLAEESSKKPRPTRRRRRRWSCTRRGRRYAYVLKNGIRTLRLPSLVERAHIPRESISARLPVSLPYSLPCLLPRPLISRSRLSRSLFPPAAHGSAPSPIYLAVLHLLRHRAPCHPCAARAERSGADRSGVERRGAARRGRPPLMNVI